MATDAMCSHWPGEGLDHAATPAHDLQRGVLRLFSAHGFSPLAELPLPNGLRADVAGLSPQGVIWIAEIKSSLADFRADAKWRGYRPYCDALYFAVSARFPVDVLPGDAGLIVADKYGGEILRPAPVEKAAAPARRSVTLRFARCAAARLADKTDPDFFRDIGP